MNYNITLKAKGLNIRSCCLGINRTHIPAIYLLTNTCIYIYIIYVQHLYVSKTHVHVHVYYTYTYNHLHKSIGNPPPKGVYTCVICQQKEHDHHGRPLSNQPQIYWVYGLELTLHVDVSSLELHIKDTKRLVINTIIKLCNN